MKKNKGLPHFDPPPMPPKPENPLKGYTATDARRNTEDARNNVFKVLQEIKNAAQEGRYYYKPPLGISAQLERDLKDRGFMIKGGDYMNDVEYIEPYISWQ